MHTVAFNSVGVLITDVKGNILLVSGIVVENE
jgi:hypothetical protein